MFEGATSIRTAFREATLILLASIVFGFGYTIVMKKGLFAPPKPVQSAEASSVAPEFISYEEAARLFERGAALFVDARHDYDYKLGHIKGAMNVPLKDFDLASSQLSRVPKDTLIVTYCDGADCNSSVELAQKLSAAGFTNVRIFFGGWNEWKQ
ncbi:MAG TPA: rhodanese-like domain-containing protein, partial [Bacteroidota bacterium]|nr:rhodanese-like domain-containing protein [Bacteroidota bacterium]